MATDNEPEVKDVERVEVTPAPDDDEEVVTLPESSPEKKPEGEAETPAPATPDNPTPAERPTVHQNELVRLDGETDREYAQRLEIKKLRESARDRRSGELLGNPPPPPSRSELSPEKKKVLEKYNPAELGHFKEVLEVMAEDLGFVRKEQLSAGSYNDKANDVVQGFLDKHTEYLPESDPDGSKWARLQEEFSIFKLPTNPRDINRLLERAHLAAFGIKNSAGPLPKIAAAKEKTNVASHSGNSAPPVPPPVRRGAPQRGLRLDMLKGFSDEEIQGMSGEQG